MQPVADLPLHRRLGLTDGELERITCRPRTRSERLRAGRLLAAVVGALRLQALRARCCAACRPRARACCRARARTPAWSTSATASAVVFKMESHNHPSAVEPFQGAATGVGGILRDIFTMGARPIALLDSLRFGAARRAAHALPVRRRASRHRRTTATASACPPSAARSCFDRGYDRQPASSTRCASGLARGRRAACAPAPRRRQPGACWSAPHRARRHPRRHLGLGRRSTRASDAKRPTRPGGRPVHREDADRGLPGADATGAAGRRCRTWAPRASTSSAVEMAGRGGVGRRARRWTACRCARPGMTPYEMMLSESQERMLLVVEPGRRGGGRGGLARRWEPATRRDRRGHRRPAASCTWRRRDGRARHARRAAHRRGPRLPTAPVPSPAGLAERRRPARRAAARRRRGDAAARLLATPEHRPQGAGSTRSTTTPSQPNTVCGPGGDAAVLLLKATPRASP